MKKYPSLKTFGNVDPDDVISQVILPDRRRFNPWMSVPDPDWTNHAYVDCFPMTISMQHRFTFDLILINLAISQEPISIFLDKGYYRSIRTKPADLTPTNIGPICNLLRSKGYMTLSKGYSIRGKYGVSSTIQPTDKLLALIPDDLQANIRREGLIVVKEFDPPEVYPDDVQAAEDVLFKYNQTVEPKNMLYATYKNSFNVDGRFHGSSVISMPKDTRKTFRVDDKETFEADVRNCIPSLLYAQERRTECPGDAYDIPGVSRDLAKVAMLIMLNCDTRQRAVKALQGVINRGTYGPHKVDDIFTAFEQKHQAIKDCLFTGIGRQLMNIESSCMRRFLQEMLDEGIKVYPIYDSVIGKATDQEVIRDTLRRSFTINDVPPVIH